MTDSNSQGLMQKMSIQLHTKRSVISIQSPTKISGRLPSYLLILLLFRINRSIFTITFIRFFQFIADIIRMLLGMTTAVLKFVIYRLSHGGEVGLTWGKGGWRGVPVVFGSYSFGLITAALKFIVYRLSHNGGVGFPGGKGRRGGTSGSMAISNWHW